jgi:hypothetical protein
MFRFDKRARNLDLPTVDLRLVDFIGMPDERQKRIVAEFDAEFGAFLQRRYPDEKLCRSMEHLNPMLNAYVDDRDARVAAGEPVVSLEDWSRDNGARYARDDVSLPHEGVRWFELRSLTTRERVGALQISKIDLVNLANKRAHLCGFAIMTLPVHPTWTYPEYWGEVLKALLERDFEDFIDPTQVATFEEWVFPTNPEARYVTRGADTFGSDIIRTASAGILLETGDTDIEYAPLNIRKTSRPSVVEVQTLKAMREAVVRPAPKRIG